MLTFSVKNKNRFSEESSFVLHSANPLSIGLDRIQLNSQIHFCMHCVAVLLKYMKKIWHQTYM